MQEIEKIIAKYLANEASTKEVEQLYQWLSHNSENAKKLNDYIKLWEHRYRDEKYFDAGIGLSKLNNKIHQTDRLSWPVWLNTAAAIGLLLISSLILWQVSSSGALHISTIVKSNPYGQKSTFQLPDGSMVKLNAGSSLEYPEVFDDNIRLVKLTGEAFFNVQKDEKHPFIVVTGEVSTKVLGTSFNINAFSNEPEIIVTVATGTVKVSENSGAQLTLKPNEAAVYKKSEKLLSEKPADIEQTLAWRDNTLLFNNASIARVINQLMHWYGVSIILENQELGQCHLTGSFKEETLPHVLQALELSTNIQYKKHADTYILYGSGCH
ncbi:FecR family protein [Fulvivirga sediminis]|uniref:FecR domain-containing protein n=1 Tax=Fulvivirga sediminis TaxID=2803949 RepID=A0A937F9S3_9BACT|nr:FecR domain-containing protein [Fulvivirga sediminis]MBL3657856.1 FecR domain-containing protein [Fulvivirga sediminis]